LGQEVAILKRGFISDALDSKLVPLDIYDNDEAQLTIMRIRLNVAIRILLNSSVIVPQGWAMDSLPLFTVISEVHTAIKSLMDIKNIDSVVPFIMECHNGNTSYHETLKAYLSRDDCHWSGLPILRAEREVREFLFTILSKSGRIDDEYIHPEIFQHHVMDCIGRQKIAKIWSDTYEYFSHPRKTKILAVDMKPYQYSKNIRLALEHLDTNLVGDSKYYDIFRELKIFNDALLQRDGGHNDTSSIMLFAEKELDSRGIQAIKHISTYAQIRAAAEATGSDSAAPAITKVNHGAAAGNILLTSAFSDVLSSQNSNFARFDMNSDLAKKLAGIDWANVFADVIRLSLDHRWRHCVRDSQVNPTVPHGNRSKDNIAELEEMLKAGCPSLVLEKCAIERLTDKLWADDTYEGRVKTTNLILATLIGVGAGAIFGQIQGLSVAVSAGIGACGGLAKPFGSQLVDTANINPFKRGGPFSSTSSIFRITS